VRLRGIVIIPRLNGFFELKDTIVFRSYGFRSFPINQVQAAYRREDPIDGFGVALILESSQVDLDFGLPTFFLAQDSVEKISEAFRLSDRLTEKLLKRPWGGVRPFAMVHHFC